MDSIRIWRSPLSRFGTFTKELDKLEANETFTASKVYSHEELSKIAKSGFNAIWVHGLLRNIVKSEVFPEFGRNSKLHLENMNDLIARADKHGLKVFVFMQPPRGIWAGSGFWKKHPYVAGCTEKLQDEDGGDLEVKCLCTSTPEVKKYLETSAAALARGLPGLGGVILITASEYPAHCWSRRGLIADEWGHLSQMDIECPRCAKRHPVEVVGEIIRLVRDGIRSISDEMEIVSWNWSWTAYEKDPSPTIIKNLPEDVIYMADFERGDEKVILGKKRPIDEYSLSFVGPSKRFAASTKIAREAGKRCMAKLQFGTTHELATVPNLPVIANIFEKVKYLRGNDIADFMGCWNFGNMITANTAAFNYFLTDEEPLEGKKSALENFASGYFPGCDPKGVARAWLKFSEAMDSYPFSIPFLYSSPINYTLAYPIRPGQPDNIPCGRSWLLDKTRGDSLEKSLEGYTLDEVIEGFEIIQKKWMAGLEILENALGNSQAQRRHEELSTARTCYHVFRSICNTYRAYRLRKGWNDRSIKRFMQIVDDEIENLEGVIPVLGKDPRQGFHGEGFGYMFDVESAQKKLDNLKALRSEA
ncbi:MAG: hypothetical protein JW808_04340 [Victivallales bacterium]|nr:hypothetical protein [Victivallales bacterium]